MNDRFNHFILFISLAFLCDVASGNVKADDDLRFSGFARIVAGYLDDEHAEFNGYENKVSLGEQSLLGLQADYQLTDTLSTTVQVIGRTGNDSDSGIEWLYLTYTPSKAMQFKLGRQRTPTFSYSDFTDVGFAYHWVSLPQQVYRQFLIPNFDGLHGQYEYVGEAFSFNLEAYIGGIDREFNSPSGPVDTDVNSMRGVVGTVDYRGWILRTSYQRGHVAIDQTEVAAFSDLLTSTGFTQSANSLSNQGVAKFYQVSAFYENVDYFFRTEAMRLKTDLFLSPETSGYFVSGGLNFSSLAVYVSLARDTNRYDQPLSEIPIGINAQLDQLALGYQQIFNQNQDNSTVSYTAGMRWDWKENVALKAEATLLKERDGFQGLFTERDDSFNGKAMLYQVALEWVF